MTEHQLEAHPLANIFPRPSKASFRALVDDIRTHGLISPITKHQAKILDGFTRYHACLEAGVVPRFVEFDGDDPLGFVISTNVHRRQMSPSQRALAAAQMHLYLNSQVEGSRLPIGSVARLLGVSERSVHRALTVLRETNADIAGKVISGSLSVSSAAKLRQHVDAPIPALDAPDSIAVRASTTRPPGRLTLSPSTNAATVEDLLDAWDGTPELATAFATATDQAKRTFIDKIWPGHPRWPIEVKTAVRSNKGTGRMLTLIRR